MAGLFDFEQPEWGNKEKELLRFASYQCAEGECDNEAKKAYICYYIKNINIWQLPPDAYKCYCNAHFNARYNMERDLRISLAAFSIDELETLQRALKELVRFGNKRAQIIEQVYADAKNKHLRPDSDITFLHEDEEFM